MPSATGARQGCATTQASGDARWDGGKFSRTTSVQGGGRKKSCRPERIVVCNQRAIGRIKTICPLIRIFDSKLWFGSFIRTSVKYCHRRSREDPDGTRSPSTHLENPARVRYHLLRLGIDISRDSHRSPRSPSVSSRGYSFFHSRPRTLWLDAAPGHASPQPPRMGGRLLSRNADFRYRLWLRVLGRAARALRNYGGGAGHHSGFHYAAGNRLPANATINGPPLSSASRWHLWCRCVGESFVFFRRSSNQSRRGDSSAGGIIHLVGRNDPY